MFTIGFKKMTVAGLLFFLLVLSKAAFAEKSVVERTSVTPVDAAVVEMAPPAPPGPYTSTGLSNITAKRAPVAKPVPVENIVDKPASMPAVRLDSREMPMAVFSPDIPWPTDLRPLNSAAPRRLTPGYETPRHNSSVGNNHRSAARPNVNLPYMNNQQPNGYGPNAGSSNNNYGYQMPSNFSPRDVYPSGYPTNRVPYPSRYQSGYPY
jgi:hypothetical protein